jgi:hypothetical protein
VAPKSIQNHSKSTFRTVVRTVNAHIEPTRVLLHKLQSLYSNIVSFKVWNSCSAKYQFFPCESMIATLTALPRKRSNSSISSVVDSLSASVRTGFNPVVVCIARTLFFNVTTDQPEMTIVLRPILVATTAKYKGLSRGRSGTPPLRYCNTVVVVVVVVGGVAFLFSSTVVLLKQRHPTNFKLATSRWAILTFHSRLAVATIAAYAARAIVSKSLAGKFSPQITF